MKDFNHVARGRGIDQWAGGVLVTAFAGPAFFMKALLVQGRCPEPGPIYACMNILKTMKVPQATMALNGIVMTHARTMFRLTPQRTLFGFAMEPTPIIEPAIACVVLTGMPRLAISTRTPPPAVSAQNPW